jgi:hypothetical protein
MGERACIALVDGVRQLAKAPIVLVWDRLNTRISHAMRELTAECVWLSALWQRESLFGERGLLRVWGMTAMG